VTQWGCNGGKMGITWGPLCFDWNFTNADGDLSDKMMLQHGDIEVAHLMNFDMIPNLRF
jgi:hypothetical protein